ncbi:MAG: hypothetical protein GY946_17310 [bacterium]|nr:hypothetical protein [bacterium]
MDVPDDPDMSEDPDPLTRLDQELRERVAGEFRRTAEEDEFTARKAALRHRTLAQVAYELLSRGDTVRATIGAESIRGVITHARGTLATLTLTTGTEFHLNLAGPLVLDVVERSTTGGRTREPYGPETFVARLRELELAEVSIEAVVGFGDSRPSGVIEAVGEDHLMLSGETTHFIPLPWIGAVRRLDL